MTLGQELLRGGHTQPCIHHICTRVFLLVCNVLKSHKKTVNRIHTYIPRTFLCLHDFANKITTLDVGMWSVLPESLPAIMHSCFDASNCSVVPAGTRKTKNSEASNPSFKLVPASYVASLSGKAGLSSSSVKIFGPYCRTSNTQHRLQMKISRATTTLFWGLCRTP